MSDHKQWCPAHPSRGDGGCACGDAEDTRTLDLFAGVEQPGLAEALAIVEAAAARASQEEQ